MKKLFLLIALILPLLTFGQSQEQREEIQKLEQKVAKLEARVKANNGLIFTYGTLYSVVITLTIVTVSIAGGFISVRIFNRKIQQNNDYITKTEEKIKEANENSEHRVKEALAKLHYRAMVLFGILSRTEPNKKNKILFSSQAISEITNSKELIDEGYLDCSNIVKTTLMDLESNLNENSSNIYLNENEINKLITNIDYELSFILEEEDKTRAQNITDRLRDIRQSQRAEDE